MIALLFLLRAILLAGQEKVSLSVGITGATPDQGHIVLSLFNSEESYMKTPFLSDKIVVNANGEAHFDFAELNPGKYAVSVYYDADSDGKLKTGFMGIPKEKVGFSNNAKGTFGPPSFKKAAFDLQMSQSIQIHLGSAKD